MPDDFTRPRFEIYNKDADYFWDNETGILYQLEAASSSRKLPPHVGDPDGLVARCVELLNLHGRHAPDEPAPPGGNHG